MPSHHNPPTFSSSIGPALGSGLGSLGAAMLGRSLGGSSDGARQRALRRGYRYDSYWTNRNENLQWSKAQARGLTPQEYYGSVASSNPVQSSGPQALGNAKNEMDKLRSGQYTEAAQRGLDRATQLKQTEIQSETQKEVAKIQAGVQTRGQDLENKIKKAKLELETQMTAKQLQKLTNEIATSTPKFMLYMKKLSMGVDNMMVEFLQHKYGVNITDPESVKGMPKGAKIEFVREVAGINSHAFREAAGIGYAAEQYGKRVAGSLPQTLPDKKPNLGRAAPGAMGGKAKSNYKSYKYSPRYGHRSHGYRPQNWYQ